MRSFIVVYSHSFVMRPHLISQVRILRVQEQKGHVHNLIANECKGLSCLAPATVSNMFPAQLGRGQGLYDRTRVMWRLAGVLTATLCASKSWERGSQDLTTEK